VGASDMSEPTVRVTRTDEVCRVSILLDEPVLIRWAQAFENEVLLELCPSPGAGDRFSMEELARLTGPSLERLVAGLPMADTALVMAHAPLLGKRILGSVPPHVRAALVGHLDAGSEHDRGAPARPGEDVDPAEELARARRRLHREARRLQRAGRLTFTD
jgi:hypothetical protein